MADPIFNFQARKEQAIGKKRNPLLYTKSEELLNFRIEQEELSSWIYLSMSLWLNNEGYTNTAKLFKKYSDEERIHAEWARDYLLAMGVVPITPALSKQPSSFTSLGDILMKAWEHEILVTEQCKTLCAEALKLNDHTLYQLGQKYLHEQVEELEKTQTLLDRYSIAEKEGNLFTFDQFVEV